MRRLVAVILLALAAPSAALAAETCPPPEDRSEERSALFDALRNAPNQRAGDRAADAIWRFWLVAPDRRADTLMSAALNEIGEGLMDSALDTFTALVEYCPGYAEAWNQRATLHFRMGNFDASLEDVERVLELEPMHFGALAGKAVMLMFLGRIDHGQRALRRAVEIHPWLRERHRLLEVPGTDL